MKRLILILTLVLLPVSGWGELYPADFGAAGDGHSDDTLPIQNMLAQCSNNSDTAIIPSGRTYAIQNPLYLWGGCKIRGDGGVLLFDVDDKYLVRVGISGVNKMEEPFSGDVSGVTFRVVGGRSKGRVLFFFRTRGANILNNVFDVGNLPYSATSSGNDVNILPGPENYIRQNITIDGNIILATSDDTGSEGIGLADFDGALITNNRVYGVGDDPIGVHYSKNITIAGNTLESVDGRIFISNTVDAVIMNNTHTRIPSKRSGKYYTGISLLYIGFENLSADNSFFAPSRITVSKNKLVYGDNSIDAGAAIYVYSPRNIIIENNEVRNESPYNTAAGVHILPALVTGVWNDPEKIDTNNIAKVRSLTLSSNAMTGTYPLGIKMTGNCSDYIGPVVVKDNLAQTVNTYCPSQVNVSGSLDWSSLALLRNKWTTQKRLIPGGTLGESKYDVYANCGGGV